MLMQRPGQQPTEEAQQQEPQQEAQGEPMTPEEQEDLNRANAALAEIIYKNDSSVNSLLKKLGNQEIPIINRLAETAMFLLTKIDSEIDIEEGVILPFLGSVYEKIAELGQEAGVLDADEKTIQQGLAVAVELALKAYGVSEEDYNEYAEKIGEQGADGMIEQYKGVMQ